MTSGFQPIKKTGKDPPRRPLAKGKGEKRLRQLELFKPPKSRAARMGRLR